MTFGRRYWTVHRGLLESASGGEKNARVQLTRICKRTTPYPGDNLAARWTPRLQHDGLLWVLRCPHRVYDVEQRKMDNRRRGSVDVKVDVCSR